MNQKGIGLLEVLLGISILSIVVLGGLQGMGQIAKINDQVKSEIDSVFLVNEIKDALGDFAQCRSIMNASNLSRFGTPLLSPTKNSPRSLRDFQININRFSTQFKKPEVKRLTMNLTVSNAGLLGNLFVANQGFSTIFSDNTSHRTDASRSAGKILSGYIRFQFQKKMGFGPGGEVKYKKLDKFQYIPIYFFLDHNNDLSRCTSSIEKFEALQGTCNSIGGLLGYDGCRIAVFESPDRSKGKTVYRRDSNTLARKFNLNVVEYAQVLGNKNNIFCKLENLIKEERPSATNELCPP